MMFLAPAAMALLIAFAIPAGCSLVGRERQPAMVPSNNSAAAPREGEQTVAHAGFVDLRHIDPPLIIDLRYATAHNFVGRPIAGYHNARALLTLAAAEALGRAQSAAHRLGYTLKVYDAYRPRKASLDFVQWSRLEGDQKMKREFYPTLDKRDIFPQGYVLAHSGHNRGSTVDVTLVQLPAKPSASYTEGQILVPATEPIGVRFLDNSIDMGTGFDAFDPAAHTAAAAPGSQAAAHRTMLLAIMAEAGFDNYAQEWWHFTLRDEPFPQTYFDFDP